MLSFSEKKVVETVQVPMVITEDMVASVIIGAFEGGSNYWLGLDNSGKEWDDKPKGEPVSTWATKLLLEGHTLHFYDIEDEEERWTLTLPQLTQGFGLNALKRPFDSDVSRGDATTADCILQYGIFGEIVFG